MNSSPINSTPNSDSPFLFGPVVKFDGEGVEETVRPSRFALWMDILSKQAVMPQDDSVSETEKSIAPGPDLRDWLSRTFE
jgi:hypothetical protein